jgi:uncharacterized membrane protein (DUF2068 family)
MKRSALVVTVLVSQFLLALLVLGTAAYVLWLTRSPDILNEPDAADAVRGLEIGAAVLGVPGLVLLVASVGLWLGRRWAWWLALATEAVMLATLLYSMLDENTVEWDEATLTLCFLIFPILLLLPRVRKVFWGGPSRHLAVSTAELKP